MYLQKLNKKDKYQIINDLENINISSTMIRNKIKNKDYSYLNNVIDEEVLLYIKQRNLYQE